MKQEEWKSLSSWSRGCWLLFPDPLHDCETTLQRHSPWIKVSWLLRSAPVIRWDHFPLYLGYRLLISALCSSWGFAQQEETSSSSALEDKKKTFVSLTCFWLFWGKKPWHFRSGLKDLRALGRAHLDLVKNAGDYRELENNQWGKKGEEEWKSNLTSFSIKI